MRKWAFYAAAGAVGVAGCGGTGGGTHSASTPVVSNSKVPVSIRLTSLTTPAPGGMDIAIMTGQGQDTGLHRFKPLTTIGALTADIQRIVFDDNYGEITNPLAPITACPLAGYQDNIIHIDVPFSTVASGVPSRMFPNYNLAFLNFLESNGPNSAPTVLNPPATATDGTAFPISYPANIRVFPGRSTSVPIFLDDSMATVNNGAVSFNNQQFQLVNGLPGSPITSFLSDLVAFNVSGLPAATKTALMGQYANAGISGFGAPTYVMFSGDKYALTDGAASGSHIAMLTTDPTFAYAGNLGAAGTLNGPNGSLPSAGTYSMLTINPTDITEMSKIISLQGIWRPSSQVLTGPGGPSLGAGTYYVTFPDSNDDNTQEFVAFTQNSSGVVSNLWYGYVDFNALSFVLYPITDLLPGTVTGAVSGTLSGLFVDDAQKLQTSSPDLVKNGNFSFSGTPPQGLANGTFRVFRL